eukprot:TRINITY_DN9141_c1_g1_i1.p1 TRINITY_DN9141_c1_g1~~TRINITY_DN9141_c1_g1_i1.p1  ORF type:complete len:618 (+),score=54.83 TRINITY_DN9141_c1_g1_i1:45-1898(+)
MMRGWRAFAFDETDGSVAQQLSTKVATRTMMIHVFAFGANSMVFIWRAMSFAAGTAVAFDSLRLLFDIITLVTQVAMIVAMFSVACFTQVESAPWEAISISATAVLVLMCPWTNQWHLVPFHESAPSSLQKAHEGDISEASCLLVLLSITLAYALFVPVRWRFNAFISACLCSSYAASLYVAGGSTGSVSVLIRLIAVASSSLASTLTRRWQDLFTQIRIETSQQQALETSDDLPDLESCCHVTATVVFQLTTALRFVGADASRDAYFGQPVDGALLRDVLLSPDIERLADVVQRIQESSVAESIKATLTRRLEVTEVDLFIRPAFEERSYEHAHLIVSATERKLVHVGSSRKLLKTSSPQSFIGSPSMPLACDDEEVIVPCGDESGSEISFTYSESDAASQTNEAHIDKDTSQWSTCEVETCVVGTQTSDIVSSSSSTREVAINTTWVAQEDTFVCTACAKPPKLPGPLPRSASKKCFPKREHEQQQQQQQQQLRRYQGSDFDGMWTMFEEDSRGAAPWAKKMVIEKDFVLLGDLSTASIVTHQSSGECSIRNGTIWRNSNGMLVRRGRSGICARYRHEPLPSDERGSDASDGSSSCAQFPTLVNLDDLELDLFKI